MKDSKYNYDFNNDKIKDFHFEMEQEKLIPFSPFDITEIQYLRGLVMSDQFVNQYQKRGEKAIIAQNKTMWEFTQEIMKKLDELEGE